jgi:hypothetical protein
MIVIKKRSGARKTGGVSEGRRMCWFQVTARFIPDSAIMFLGHRTRLLTVLGMLKNGPHVQVEPPRRVQRANQ